MKVHTKKFSTIIILSLVAFVMTSAVYAQDDTFAVKEGTYIGVFFTKNQMSGDFDDTIAYVGVGEINDLPDVDDGTGLGIVLGFKSPTKKGRGVAVEFGYQRSKHDASGILYGEGDATYSVIDLNFKIDVFARERIKPYVLLGLGITWVTIEDGLYTFPYGPEDTEDETFFGFALNAGAGAAYYFRPDLAVTGGVIYRWNRFSSVEGDKLDEAAIEKALCFRIGLAYTF